MSHFFIITPPKFLVAVGSHIVDPAMHLRDKILVPFLFHLEKTEQSQIINDLSIRTLTLNGYTVISAFRQPKKDESGSKKGE